MTTPFYAPPENILSDRIRFDTEESRHIAKVLRLRIGDEIVVVDGIGGWYRTKLFSINKSEVIGTIVEKTENVGEPAVPLAIGIGILKNASRFETFIEKAVEFGVTEIYPIQTRFSEFARIRTDRIRRIMIAAMKQCQRTRLPRFHTPVPFSELLQNRSYETRMICHENTDSTLHINNFLLKKPSSTIVLVGPEGGFSDDEIALAQENNWRLVWLGKRRLRAETAAILVAGILGLRNET